MIASNEILTGEKIQLLAQIYLGNRYDFGFNPVTSEQKEKHVLIDEIVEEFENPSLVFCYSDKIVILSSKIHFFKNNFVLITHNGDQDIEDCVEIQKILDCSKLSKWYAQNLVFYHEKLHYLPIGMANSMWSHGNLDVFENPDFYNSLSRKNKKTYFQFSLGTSRSKRERCFNVFNGKIEFLNIISSTHNFWRLKDYEFCICPEGNGVDTHRLWECLYLKTVPIVINSPFIETLKKYNSKLPFVVLNSWEDYDEGKLDYSKYSFDDIDISFEYFVNKILSE